MEWNRINHTVQVNLPCMQLVKRDDNHCPIGVDESKPGEQERGTIRHRQAKKTLSRAAWEAKENQASQIQPPVSRIRLLAWIDDGLTGVSRLSACQLRSSCIEMLQMKRLLRRKQAKDLLEAQESSSRQKESR